MIKLVSHQTSQAAYKGSSIHYIIILKMWPLDISFPGSQASKLTHYRVIVVQISQVFMYSVQCTASVTVCNSEDAFAMLLLEPPKRTGK